MLSSMFAFSMEHGRKATCDLRTWEAAILGLMAVVRPGLGGKGSTLASTLLAYGDEELVLVLSQLLAHQATGLRLQSRCC